LQQVRHCQQNKNVGTHKLFFTLLSFPFQVSYITGTSVSCKPIPKKMKLKLGFLSLFFLVLFTPSVRATHLRAGEITVKRQGCSNKFDITVTVYTDTESGVKFGGAKKDGLDVLDLGDGTIIIVPETDSQPYPGGEKIGIASYTVFGHTYGPGKWVIRYREPNRNQDVLNMTNSVLTTFYIETQLNNEPVARCNSTPSLLIPPIDRGCVGVAFQHNAGAFDPDGDSLSYELVIPFKDKNTTVDNYRDPNNQQFYTGNYENANEQGNGRPTFTINQQTGTVSWDAPGVVGEFNIAFHIIEWREIFGVWTKLGYVRRDMQIIIEDCDNERPDLVLPQDTCVVAGTTLEAIIKGFDVPTQDGDIDSIYIESFSEIFDAGFVTPATVSANPAKFSPRTANNPALVNFRWETNCGNIKDQPYQVVFKISDRGRPRLATFKTWFIKVIAPPPVWNQTSVDLAKRHVLLEWQDYECTNATSMQVWRRVDSFAYTPSNCETGMPLSLGYELIAEVPVTDKRFNDTNRGKGLNIGAKYCYRLVAKFPSPPGGESIMSDEICVDPIYSDAPIITHVTVDKTNTTDGRITVSWKKPIQIDEVQFPPPYKYKVWRSEGFVGARPWTAVHDGIIDDTTHQDIGINTLDRVFSYHVVVHANLGSGFVAIDTSSVASSVRLEIQSGKNKLDLSWSAFTPWSNSSFSFPNHDLFRGPGGATETGLTLYEAINVTTDGFVYSDEPLDDDDEFCYRVMTRGTYGNPAIDEPQINYSQIACARPNDTIPPSCVLRPIIVNKLSCEDYLSDAETCGINFFKNELRWDPVTTEECLGDILGYRVYVANSADGTFSPITFAGGKDYTQDTVFVDDNGGLGLTSFAKCYRVSVVDRSGNESELSEAVCNDNCPYYAMPNVFTPNGDGCNDRFSAFGDPFTSGEESPGTNDECLPNDSQTTLCARFVETVVFKVFNRWGNEMYQFESVPGDTDSKSIFVRWDGRDNNGNPLAAGVYYYAADVTFTTSDPAKRKQTIKGWVHLIR
jgi:hypothetical protein